MAKKSNIELNLEHKMPIFVDEYYAIKLTIENKEESAIENLKYLLLIFFSLTAIPKFQVFQQKIY